MIDLDLRQSSETGAQTPVHPDPAVPRRTARNSPRRPAGDAGTGTASEAGTAVGAGTASEAGTAVGTGTAAETATAVGARTAVGTGTAVGTEVSVSGILDIRDGHGVLRVSGYRPSSGDVAVPPARIRQYGLRRGDAVTGAARAAGPGRRDRSDQLLRVDTVNGCATGAVGDRPEFHQQTPLFPQDRLRLETEPHILTTRLIDLLTPIGKGQRALIVSPPKAGKTMVLQAIAHAITTNHPDCHLMALLVDERPEEVTDMTRSLHGEVVASTFDRPPAEHIAVAELAIERAKRLAEGGRDVVVLVDSITRLARAYNLAAPAGGRIMTGGIEVSALLGPKRILGAARKLEDGGSLTIIATALVETGSVADTIVFEEFKSTGNAELRLLRAMADRRVFPAVDTTSSGTRREELLLGADELRLVHQLRRALGSGDQQHGGEQLLDGLRRTGSNAEFLLRIAQSTPAAHPLQRTQNAAS
ncbi:transcription termination factor Rho [Longispora urticae]